MLAFYTQTAKQVQDVHEEAKRIAQAQQEKQQQHEGVDTVAGNSAAPAPVAAESTSVHHTTTVPGAAF